MEYGRIVYRDGDGLYVNTGTSFVQAMWTQITDDMSVTQGLVTWSMRHAHDNMAALEKLSESNGSLLYDGKPAGVIVAASANLLPANAPDGSVAVATGNGTVSAPVALPPQIADEQVEADIADKALVFGAPTYNASALNAAITAADLSAAAAISIDADGNYEGGEIEVSLLPVVADISDNAFTAAGLTLDAESMVLSQNATKPYAILLNLAASGLGLIKPDEIIQIDSTHISVPGIAVYAFEPLSGIIGDMVSGTLHAGWNTVRLTIEMDGSQFIGITGAVLASDVADVNAVVDLESSANNVMTLEGAGASQLLAGVIASASTLPKGLYVKLDTWKRMAAAEELSAQ